MHRFAVVLLLLATGCNEAKTGAGQAEHQVMPAAAPKPLAVRRPEPPKKDTSPCGLAAARCQEIQQMSAGDSRSRGANLMLADSFCQEVARAVLDYRRAQADAEQNKRYGINADYTSFQGKARDRTCSLMLQQINRLDL